MSSETPPLRWTDVDTYATCRQVTRESVLDQIHAGTLTGLVTRSGWYVLEQLVALELPDADQPTRARLHVLGCLQGEWLTVCGSETVVLEVTYDETIRTAIGTLWDLDRPEHPRTPVTLTLNDQRVIVDLPLQADLLAALLEWQVEVELGDLLKQHRPDGHPYY